MWDVCKNQGGDPVQDFFADASSLQAAHKKALGIRPGPGTDQLLDYLVSVFPCFSCQLLSPRWGFCDR